MELRRLFPDQATVTVDEAANQQAAVAQDARPQELRRDVGARQLGQALDLGQPVEGGRRVLGRRCGVVEQAHAEQMPQRQHAPLGIGIAAVAGTTSALDIVAIEQ